MSDPQIAGFADLLGALHIRSEGSALGFLGYIDAAEEIVRRLESGAQAAALNDADAMSPGTPVRPSSRNSSEGADLHTQVFEDELANLLARSRRHSAASSPVRSEDWGSHRDDRSCDRGSHGLPATHRVIHLQFGGVAGEQQRAEVDGEVHAMVADIDTVARHLSRARVSLVNTPRRIASAQASARGRSISGLRTPATMPGRALSRRTSFQSAIEGIRDWIFVTHESYPPTPGSPAADQPSPAGGAPVLADQLRSVGHWLDSSDDLPGALESRSQLDLGIPDAGGEEEDAGVAVSALRVQTPRFTVTPPSGQVISLEEAGTLDRIDAILSALADMRTALLSSTQPQAVQPG